MVLLESLPEVIINKIKSYVIFTPNNKELKRAVNLWCEDKRKAYKLFGHISSWNTEHITDMRELFKKKYCFNSVISSWNVSNVTNMNEMFFHTLFNQPLNKWDVSSVKYMYWMFRYTKSLTNLPEWYSN